MSCLGIHFSLSDSEVDHLLRIGDDGRRLHYFRESIEPLYVAEHPERIAESGTAWDAMHRALAEGTLSGEGRYPLNHVVLGGTSLYAGDDFVMRLKARNQVQDVARVLPAMTHSEFHRRYRAIPTTDHAFIVNNEEFDETWRRFEGVRSFWLRAAEEGRYVLFTANGRIEPSSSL
ncbi:DUF1877 family protein [Labrys monachus]|uniref:Uncharacterized protein n=1 Tax=Labrys monachus TaxID=217067 RepID=A0ABU0FJH2_9HYPH|nr:DUF1877 family protein [Labrys monachus]MDQ0394200.1 hypothetical protein [Labrys monachus]